jgi:exonuclease III
MTDGRTAKRLRGGTDVQGLTDITKAKPPTRCRITTINIRAGHGAAAHNLQAVAKEGDEKHLDIIVVQETKISNEKHTRFAGSYDIFASETLTGNWGGVAFFVCRQGDGPQLGWSAEDPKIYDMNVLAITLVSGKMRRRLVGVYLSPSVISDATWSGLRLAAMDPIWILGDFNVDLHTNRATRLNAALNDNSDGWSVEVQAFVATMGVESFGHTKLQHRKSGVWTWSLSRTVAGQHQLVKSICDYILGPKTDRVLNYRTRKTTLIDMDHRMVYLDLKISLDEHKQYMRCRKKFPTMKGPQSEVDMAYAELIELQQQQMVERHKAKPGWISNQTWELIRLRRSTTLNTMDTDGRARKSQLKHQIRRQLKRDCMVRFDEEAKAIEEAMANNDPKAGFQIMKKWLKRPVGFDYQCPTMLLKMLPMNGQTCQRSYGERQLSKGRVSITSKMV